MLKFKLNGMVLEVEERIFSFDGNKVTYWYYDLKEWKKSIKGKKDEIPTLLMDDKQIEWVLRYYIPKVDFSEKDKIEIDEIWEQMRKSNGYKFRVTDTMNNKEV